MGKQVQGSPPARPQPLSTGHMVAVPPPVSPRPIIFDPYRSFVFPNRIRELRGRHGFPTLLALATALPEIPYIRLSKIERGEVVARADEIVRIAGLLHVAPGELLIDVDDPAFDIEAWSEPFQDGKAADEAEEKFAVLLAAAMRARRTRAADLTIATIERDYGIPPVILSRIENALKKLDRWNDATLRGICRLFGVGDEQALRARIEEQYRQGLLDDFVGIVADPAARLEKTRSRIGQLRSELDLVSGPVARLQQSEPRPVDPRSDRVGTARNGLADQTGAEKLRLLPVVGAPLPGGLIAPVETGSVVEAPRSAGPRAFGLRICRPTLGAGLPGNAVVVVDPDVFPSSGGLAAVRELGNYRLLAVTFDLNGAMIGRSVNPSLEVALDTIDPSDVAAIISASFI